MSGLTFKKMHMAGLMGAALMFASAGWAETGLVPNALSEGSVGEQADGYMGFRTAPTDALRAEVDAINIKRRAVYTQLASQRGVTVKDVAATVGCETLKSRVASGRSYLLPDGVWRVKGSEPITLPAYCGN